MVTRVSEQLNTQNNSASIRSMWGTIFYNAKVYDLVGDGTVNDYTKLYNLINTTINGAEATIIFPKGTYKISSNITIPSNISLYFVKGAMLSPDSGVAVTINGPIEAGLWQIFTGSGTISGSMKVDFFYPQWWGAKGDGVTDDTAEINAAIDVAIAAGGGIVYFPEGVYITSSTLLVDGNNIIIQGVGWSSEIRLMSHPHRNITITGVRGCQVIDIQLSLGLTGQIRDDADVGIYVNTSATDFLISNVYGNKKSIMVRGSVTGGTIEKCLIENTLADGIHITGTSKDISVINNRLTNTGDDSIAVVSYQSDTSYCERVVVANNIIKNSKARGISHVGGKNVTISDNIINGTASSGVIVVKDATFNTFEPNDTIINGNQILNAGQVTPRVGNQFGIEVTTDAVRTKIGENLVKGSYSRGISSAGTKVSIIDNDVFSNGNDGINVASDTGTIVEGNRIEENVGYGLFANTIRNGSFNGNQLLNNNTAGTGGVDNAHFVSCSFGEIIGNTSADNRGTPLIERTFEINACSEMKISGNIDDAGGGTRVMTFNAGCSNVWVIEGIIGSYVPTTTIHATGQHHWNPTSGIFYVYNGSAWKSVTLA